MMVKKKKTHTTKTRKKSTNKNALKFKKRVIVLVLFIVIGIVLLLIAINFNSDSNIEKHDDAETLKIVRNRDVMENLFENCYEYLQISRTYMEIDDAGTLFINLTHDKDYMLDVAEDAMDCTRLFSTNLIKDITLGNLIPDVESFPKMLVVTFRDFENQTVDKYSLTLNYLGE